MLPTGKPSISEPCVRSHYGPARQTCVRPYADFCQPPDAYAALGGFLFMRCLKLLSICRAAALNGAAKRVIKQGL